MTMLQQNALLYKAAIADMLFIDTASEAGYKEADKEVVLKALAPYVN